MSASWSTRKVGWLSMTGLAVLAIPVSIVLLAGGSKPNSHAGNTGSATTSSPPTIAASAVRVRTIRPTRERLQRTITEAAHVEPFEQADLFAKAAGYLEKVNADIGARVKKDDVLAELWVPEMVQEREQKKAMLEKASAELGQAKAAFEASEAMAAAARARIDEAVSLVTRYEADVTYHKGEHTRYLGLFNDRAVQKDVVDRELNLLRASEASLTSARNAVATARANLQVEQAKSIQAKADVDNAQARIKVANANLEQAEIMLRYAKVTAPYDGVITQRMIHPGAFIQSASTGKATPLFAIARVDRMRIVAAVPETSSTWIKLGQPATLSVDALRGQRFTGRIVRSADALDPATRTMRVEVELDEPTRLLRPGMYGKVSITLADYPDAIMLPTSALVAGSGKPTVMIVKDGHCHRQEITLGYNDGVRMQVAGGLAADAEVITDGKDSLGEGQAVTVVP
ncbi:MAG: efflux RND transporter periplasmic adaptor subunit [Gemmataceae bacterium]